MSDESICLVRGSINIDEFYDLPTIVRPGQTISALNFSKRLGGKGANQARAAASAGAQVLLDAAVGSGVEGESVKKELCEAVKGVENIGLTFDQGAKAEGRILGERIRTWDDGSTGKAIIQRAQDGENSIIILAGANASLPAKPYTSLIPPHTTHLLLANEIPLVETLAYLRAAAESREDVTTIYNPSPMPTTKQLAAFPWECVGWLIVNEGELGDIAEAVFGESSSEGLDGSVKDAVKYLTNGKGKDDDGEKTIEAANVVAKALHTALPRLSTSTDKNTNATVVNIICTLGPSGVLYVRSTATKGEAPAAKCLPVAKLLRPIRDTTGAGDCFMGFLAAGLMRLQKEGGAEEEQEEKFEGVLKRCLTRTSLILPWCVGMLDLRGE
ncbi:hypothetical protein QFC22_003691 [Naganishia vaughanmartiniae]|uniref:Uncharacterized protein n=1 Tax=Naganishia vaughanmartiniae TaxID=1424756 RepID=A0ACC2X597_9TREE|nr:hypothetical protein QFC22_003691 [Naganishia vaughanmartiniae]